jgi:hypothetical protein
VSETYKVRNAERTRITKIIGTITLNDNTEINITNANILGGSLYTSSKCVNSGAFELGSAIIGEMGLSLIIKTLPEGLNYRSFFNAKVALSYWLRLDSETWEEVPLGIYNVYEPSRPTQKHIQLKAYDNMARFDKKISRSSGWSKTLYQALLFCCTSCGVEIGQTQVEIESMVNGNVAAINFSPQNQAQIITYRDCIMYIAQLLCGFATTDRAGKLKIKSLANTSSAVTITASERQNCKVSDSIVKYDSIQMQVWLSNTLGGTTTHTYPSDAAGLSVLQLKENPLLRTVGTAYLQQYLSNLATAVTAIEYSPSEPELFGNPALDIGDYVTLTGGVAGTQTKTLITNSTWYYRGKHALKSAGTGAEADTKSVKSQSDKAADDIKQTIDNLYNKTAEDYDNLLDKTESLTPADVSEIISRAENSLITPEIPVEYLTYTKAYNDSTGSYEITITDCLTSIQGDFAVPSYIENAPVVVIADSAFENCAGLTSIKLPDTLREIKSNFAFRGCTGLKSVEFGNGLIAIGGEAFENCVSLTDVVIPDSVTRSYSTSGLEGKAFKNCTSLEHVVIGKGLGSRNYTYPEQIQLETFYGCTKLKYVEMYDNITHIGTSAFQGCIALESISYSKNLVQIGSDCFRGCTGLKSFLMPKSLTTIKTGAFTDCTGLKSLYIPSNVSDIGSAAFKNCTGLKTVTILHNPSSIWTANSTQNSFYGCSPDLIIYGKAGTKIETLANNMGFTFIAV